MKKEPRKLAVSRETLARLTEREMERAAAGSGGGWSDQSVCPSAVISECRTCS